MSGLAVDFGERLGHMVAGELLMGNTDPSRRATFCNILRSIADAIESGDSDKLNAAYDALMAYGRASLELIKRGGQ